VSEATDTAEADDTGSSDRPRVRKIEGPAAEPIDVAGLAGPAVLKRFAPLAIGVLLVIVIIRALR
jgi:hypothetical protein